MAISPSTRAKLARQRAEDAREESYRAVVATDFVQRCPRRRIPAECVSDLQTLRCYPRQEPDGSWTAMDTPRTAAVLASRAARQQRGSAA